MPRSKRRWFRPTPDRLIVGLVAIEGLVWLSDWLRWPAWHKGYAVLTTLALLGVAPAAMFVWFLGSLLFRWRFQFSLHSLLVLVVVVAIPCSWLATEMKKAREQAEFVRAIQEEGGYVSWDYEKDKQGLFVFAASRRGRPCCGVYWKMNSSQMSLGLCLLTPKSPTAGSIASKCSLNSPSWVSPTRESRMRNWLTSKDCRDFVCCT